jgi:hypothetical protein
VHKALLLGLVGLIALVLGIAVAGRPSSVPNDLVASDISAPSIPTTSVAGVTTTAAPETTPPATDLTTTTFTPSSTVPTTTTTLVPERSVRIVVANATNVARLAARTVEGLRRYGYTDLVATDAVADRPDTVIYYVDGRHREALRLAAQLGLDATRVHPRPALDLTVTGEASDVWLVIGSDVGGG